MALKQIINFFYELGHLWRVKREGWRLIGVEHPESVAEHSLRAAQIGYVLAKMEGYSNPYEVVTAVVFHDIGEARVGDIHKLANRYCEVDEDTAVVEQLSRLGAYKEELLELWRATETQSTPAGIIAKDADLLELCVRAHELLEIGYKAADEWVRNAGKFLSTESAKKLLAELSETPAFTWWDGLKKF